jgi:predicted transporter
MLFAGLYFLATVIVLPNINQVLQSPMKPYDVSSMSTIIYVVVLAVVLIIIGVYKTKRESIWR